LDEGIGYTFARAFQDNDSFQVINRTLGPEALECPLSLICVGVGCPASFSCLSPAKLTVAVDPLEGDLSILADLDQVAVGITHVAAPFPAVIVLV
jgi:hypothetical protein